MKKHFEKIRLSAIARVKELLNDTNSLLDEYAIESVDDPLWENSFYAKRMELTIALNKLKMELIKSIFFIDDGELKRI